MIPQMESKLNSAGLWYLLLAGLVLLTGPTSASNGGVDTIDDAAESADGPDTASRQWTYPWAIPPSAYDYLIPPEVKAGQSKLWAAINVDPTRYDFTRPTYVALKLITRDYSLHPIEKLVDELGMGLVFGQISTIKPLTAIRDMLVRMFEPGSCLNEYACKLGAHASVNSRSDISEVSDDESDSQSDRKATNRYGGGALFNSLAVAFSNGRCNIQRACEPRLREPFQSWAVPPVWTYVPRQGSGEDDVEARQSDDGSKPFTNDYWLTTVKAVQKISEDFDIKNLAKMHREIGENWIYGPNARRNPALAMRTILMNIFETDTCLDGYACRLMSNFPMPMEARAEKSREGIWGSWGDTLFNAITSGFLTGRCDPNMATCTPKLKEPFKSMTSRQFKQKRTPPNASQDAANKPREVVEKISKAHKIDVAYFTTVLGRDVVLGNTARYSPLRSLMSIVASAFVDNSCRTNYICQIGSTMRYYENDISDKMNHMKVFNQLLAALISGIEGVNCDKVYGGKCNPSLQEPFKSLAKAPRTEF